MKVARIIVLVVALAAGLVAAMLASRLSAPTPGETTIATRVQPAFDTVDVLVAKQDIPLGSSVTAASIEWRTWPKAGVAASYLERGARPNAAAEVTGTIARGTFLAGEPISEAKLVRSDQGYLSAILPAGKRAAAVAISAVTAAGGFILPNDRVDVVMTREVGDSDQPGGRYETETILHNVRVLAIDQTLEDKEGEKVVVGKTATLELTPEQTQILNVAGQMNGRLSLTLRSLADAEEKPANGDAMHLIGGPSARTGVTVVRHGVVQEVTINR